MLGITPFVTSDKLPGELKDQVTDLYSKSAELEAKVRPGLYLPLTYLLRMVNSYYSNKIEGNKTQPADVIKAQAEDDLNADPALRDDKREILAHIKAQQFLIEHPPEKQTISSPEFLKEMHHVFFADATLEQRTIRHDGITAVLEPGEFRENHVIIGQHHAPDPEDLGVHLRWFQNAYRLDWIHGEAKVIAAAAAHHRLLYIHPFLDGNGRIARLFTDEYLRLAGLGGYGLWSISRGLSRNGVEYKAALAKADCRRQGDHDGRGALSAKGLLEFTEFFLATCRDQLSYLSNLLDMTSFDHRLQAYCQLRAAGAGADISGKPLTTWRPEVYRILQEAVNSSEGVLRSRVPEITGLGVTTSRNIVNQLIEEGWLQGEAKQPLRLAGIPFNAISVLFPHLW